MAVHCRLAVHSASLWWSFCCVILNSQWSCFSVKAKYRTSSGTDSLRCWEHFEICLSSHGYSERFEISLYLAMTGERYFKPFSMNFIISHHFKWWPNENGSKWIRFYFPSNFDKSWYVSKYWVICTLCQTLSPVWLSGHPIFHNKVGESAIS